jgi:hypothetical protein
MFYSRPKIEPLGWDLIGLPEANGSRNFDGTTSDGQHAIDFRFSSGWLTVTRDSEEVLSLQIAPFGIMDIWPEQICDILGLTIDGEKVSLDPISSLSRGFDWSGQTTYWRSKHRMNWDTDAETLVRIINETFPGSVLLQPSWGSGLRVRSRQIKFMMRTDEMVSIGIDCEKDRLERMLAAETVSDDEFESILTYRIDVIRSDHYGEDLTGIRFIKSKGADELQLDYDVTAQRKFRIETTFRTDDMRAQSIMKKLLAIIDGFFCRGMQVVNLQTGSIMGEDSTDDEEDSKSYSRSLRDWCMERPRRFLFVSTHQDRDERLFVGYRPLTT